MESKLLLTLLFLLTFKHLVVDFFLQPEWMWRNKGTYGHLGGIAHALLHGYTSFIVTVCALLIFTIQFTDRMFMVVIIFILLESILHYHIDWLKMNICRVKCWGPQDPEFWHMLGIDQFLHYCCYLGMIGLLWVEMH